MDQRFTSPALVICSISRQAAIFNFGWRHIGNGVKRRVWLTCGRNGVRVQNLTLIGRRDHSHHRVF
ncbi:13579_t:CDS:2 [Cetraspora pellucida]|uniref:13579_t:CDS:1 n=1 Tax=Cetraspora pellucida TaxID=1433469 RepID=A0A9N9N595_9GLOM|nr:13579_t:CDS:2 [Cetraspora pellucida]